jgi:SecY
MLTTLSLSILYVQSGFLNIQHGEYNGLLVVIQLFGGGIVSYFLNEILDYYGICCAITLLMAKNVCKMIFGQAFSPVTIDTGRGPEFEGSVICFVHLLFSWANKGLAVHESFFRQNQPNLITLGSTILVFLVVIYLQGVRIEMPVKSRAMLGQHGTFQIKLLYPSNKPVLAQVPQFFVVFMRAPNKIIVSSSWTPALFLSIFPSRVPEFRNEMVVARWPLATASIQTTAPVAIRFMLLAYSTHPQNAHFRSAPDLCVRHVYALLLYDILSIVNYKRGLSKESRTAGQRPTWSNASDHGGGTTGRFGRGFERGGQETCSYRINSRRFCYGAYLYRQRHSGSSWWWTWNVDCDEHHVLSV